MWVAYVIDPPAGLVAATDSTVELIRCHARRGDQVSVIERDGISMRNGVIRLDAARIHTYTDDVNWYRLEHKTPCHASDFDLIMMRLEPPVDASFRHICQLLELVQASGVPVVNSPVALLSQEEKLGALQHPRLCPPTLVSRARLELLEFAAQLGNGCVLKELDGSRGQGVYTFACGDSNLAVAIDQGLANGKTLVVQERLAGIAQGDRRVFMIAGEPYAKMLNRLPGHGSHLGNMAAGGQAVAMELGAAERDIGRALTDSLNSSGITFAGIDVIDGKLTEINITCPTGLRQVREQLGDDVASAVIDAAMRKRLN